MKQKGQLSLFKETRKNTKLWWIENHGSYGGALNYRKVKRPFSSKKLVHVVFKGRLGRGIYFTRSRKSCERVLHKVAKRYGVNIKSFAINKDHIHLLIWTKQRESFLRFLRYFACELGRKYKEIFLRYGIRKPKGLWLHRPFTRLVSWGKRSVENVVAYIDKNHQEAMGFLQYTPRSHRLDLFLKRWMAMWDTC